MTRHTYTWTSFALGLAAGVVLRELLTRAAARIEQRRAAGTSGDTVVYDENLPESLERREPAPQRDQPRYGGTGAIGVSPAVAMTKAADGE